MKQKFLYKFYLVFVLAFLYLPIFVLVLFAFNESKSRAVFSGFSLKWFINLIQNGIVLNAFWNSFFLATISATIATAIGTWFALQITKLPSSKQSIFLNLNYFPIINSDVAMGVSLMLTLQLFLNLIKQNMSFFTVLIAHIIICMPYVVFLLVQKIRQLDVNQLNAALDLGCTPRMAFFKVVIAQILAEIFGAFMIAFSVSFDDFTIAYFTAGTSFQTLPLLIYSMVRKRITPAINALFTIIFIFTLIMLLVFNFLNLKLEKSKISRGSL